MTDQTEHSGYTPEHPSDIEIRPSTFRHGYTESDVRSVLSTFILNQPLRNREDVELVIGFSAKGETLEMFFESVADKRVVFHLMKCRKQYLDLIKKSGGTVYGQEQ